MHVHTACDIKCDSVTSSRIKNDNNYEIQFQTSTHSERQARVNWPDVGPQYITSVGPITIQRPVFAGQ